MAADRLPVTGQGDIKRSSAVLGIDDMDLAVNVGGHTEIRAQLASASLYFHVCTRGAQKRSRYRWRWTLLPMGSYSNPCSSRTFDIDGYGHSAWQRSSAMEHRSR